MAIDCGRRGIRNGIDEIEAAGMAAPQARTPAPPVHDPANTCTFALGFRLQALCAATLFCYHVHTQQLTSYGVKS